MALDLTKDRITPATPIASFTKAVGEVLSMPSVGEKLFAACTSENSPYNGVLTAGALRALGATAQKELYMFAKLGANFDKTINPYLRCAGEESYVPSAAAGLDILDETAGGGEDAALSKKRAGGQELSFRECQGEFPTGFIIVRDIAVLPGCVVDELPTVGCAITKPAKVVAMIKTWLLVSYKVVHFSHPLAAEDVSLIVRRIASLIVLPSTDVTGGRGHAIYEGKPSIKYEKEMAIVLLVEKTKSKLTQDRQNVRATLQGKAVGRLTRLLSPADAERVSDILQLGFGRALHPTSESTRDLKISTVATLAPPPPDAAQATPTAGGADDLADTDGGGGGDGFEGGFDQGFGEPPLPRAAQTVGGNEGESEGGDGGPTGAAEAASVAARAAAAAEETKKRKAEQKAQRMAKKAARMGGGVAGAPTKGKTKAGTGAGKENSKENSSAEHAQPNAKENEEVHGMLFEQSMLASNAKYELVPLSEAKELVCDKESMEKFIGFGDKSIRVALLCKQVELAPPTAELTPEEEDARLFDEGEKIVTADWYVGHFSHLKKKVTPVDKKSGKYWVNFADTPDGMLVPCLWKDYGICVADKAWVLVRTSEPDDLSFE